MTADEIRKKYAELDAKDADVHFDKQQFWLAEIAAQLAELNEAARQAKNSRKR